MPQRSILVLTSLLMLALSGGSTIAAPLVVSAIGSPNPLTAGEPGTVVVTYVDTDPVPQLPTTITFVSTNPALLPPPDPITVFSTGSRAVDINPVAGSIGPVSLTAIGGGGGASVIFTIVPENNDCADAIAVVGSMRVIDINGATTTGTSTCNVGEGDVWLRYSSSASGFFVDIDTIGTVSAGGPAVTLSAHSSCPGDTGNEIACADSQPDASLSFLYQSGGDTVYIRVSPTGSVGSGLVTLNFGFRYLNDACEFASPVTLIAQQTLALATNDGDASCALDDNAADLWYEFTAPDPGTLVAYTEDRVTDPPT